MECLGNHGCDEIFLEIFCCVLTPSSWLLDWSQTQWMNDDHVGGDDDDECQRLCADHDDDGDGGGGHESVSGDSHDERSVSCGDDHDSVS